MFSAKGKLFPAFFMKKSTISPGIARLRDCEIARLRDSESAKLRECEITQDFQAMGIKLLRTGKTARTFTLSPDSPQ